MSRAIEFMARLRAEGIPFTLEALPHAAGIRVRAIAWDEVWEVDFGARAGDDEIESLVFTRGASSRRGLQALDEVFGKVGRAWRAAAADLGLELVMPFVLVTGDGTTVAACGLLPRIGTELGTVIGEPKDDERALERLESEGYFVPGLNPTWYARYERARFLEAVREWGWRGRPEDCPTLLRGPAVS